MRFNRRLLLFCWTRALPLAQSSTLPPLPLLSKGIGDDHVVHLVKSKPSSGGASTAAAAAASSPGAATSSGLGGAIPPAAAGAAAGGGLESLASQMASNPMMQAMMSNPELLRSVMQAHPAIREVRRRLASWLLTGVDAC
jgi:hypothetical protein